MELYLKGKTMKCISILFRFCQNPVNRNFSVKQFYACPSLQLNKGQAKNQEKGRKTGPSFQSLNSNFKNVKLNGK